MLQTLTTDIECAKVEFTEFHLRIQKSLNNEHTISQESHTPTMFPVTAVLLIMELTRQLNTSDHYLLVVVTSSKSLRVSSIVSML